MGYQIVQFGSLFVNKNECEPNKPPIDGFMANSINFFSTSDQKHTLTWIQPDGCRFFIADRVLIKNISWRTLASLDYHFGREVNIDGQSYACRLMTRFEWKTILDSVGENQAEKTLHINNIFSLTNDTVSTDGREVFCCGRFSNVSIQCDIANLNIGFRPILVPKGSMHVKRYQSESSVLLEDQLFSVEFSASIEHHLSKAGFRPSLIPVQKSSVHDGYEFDKEVFNTLPQGQNIRMYTLLMDGSPVPMQEGCMRSYKPGSSLVFTDHYFGDEYLIDWTIQDGKAVASWPILCNISKSEIMGQMPCDERETKLW